MKKLFLIFFFSFLIIHIGYCQLQPVELSIKSDKQIYEAGEKIILEATFKNNSEKDVIIYWSRGTPNTQRNVTEGNGFVTIYTSESLFPEVKKIYLGYKESATKIIKIPTFAWPPLPYQVKLEYVPVNIDLNFKMPAHQKILDHTITSNTLSLKVINSQKFKK